MALIPFILVALLAPTVSPDATLEPFSFEDLQGDVHSPDGTTHAGMAANDVLGGGVQEQDGRLAFWLELEDLSTIDSAAEEEGYHIQFALSFITQAGHDGYSMRATYDSRATAALPILDPVNWRFQIHDREADTWSHAEGTLDGDTIRWNATPATFDLAKGDTLADWGVQVWSSFDSREQWNDWAGGPGGYRLGEGAFYPADPMAVGDVVAGAVASDPSGDVDSRGRSYTGPGAANTDILALTMAETDDSLVARLSLVDLAKIGAQDDEARYHVQYAVTFDLDEATYSFRATYRGVDMSNGGPGWTFQLHDHGADDWPGIPAAIDGNSIVWVLDKATIGASDGDVLGGFRISTWASFDRDRDQYGDNAQGGTYTVAEGPTYTGDTFQESDAATLENDIPHVGLVALAAVLLVAARRRNG